MWWRIPFPSFYPYEPDEERTYHGQQKKGVAHENGPGEGGMLHIGGMRRKLQIRGDFLVGEYDTQHRKSQQHYCEQGEFKDRLFHVHLIREYKINHSCLQSQKIQLGGEESLHFLMEKSTDIIKIYSELRSNFG